MGCRELTRDREAEPCAAAVADQKGRKIRSTSSSGMPGPVSSTATEIVPFSCSSASSTRPPSGVQRKAFASRLEMICSTRSPSAMITGRAPITCR